MSKNNNMDIQNAIYTVSKQLFFKKIKEIKISKCEVLHIIKHRYKMSDNNAETFLYNKAINYYKYEFKITSKNDLLFYLLYFRN